MLKVIKALKATPKAMAKVAATPAPLGPKKKPSAKVSAKRVPLEPQKKPAAGPRTLKQQLAEFKEGVEDNDDENSLWDKQKGGKFAKMMASGSLPDHVQDLFNTEAGKKTSPRQFRTQIINTLFTKDDAGRWLVNIEAPLFTEHRKMYERRYGRDEQKALPRSVFLGLYFQNNEAALKAALACGDVNTTTGDDNREYCSFRYLVIDLATDL